MATYSGPFEAETEYLATLGYRTIVSGAVSIDQTMALAHLEVCEYLVACCASDASFSGSQMTFYREGLLEEIKKITALLGINTLAATGSQFTGMVKMRNPRS